MEFAKKHQGVIREMYDKGSSSYEIAEHLGTYSTKILRCLKYLGVEARDYKDAQKIAMKTGRSQHPTKGKKLSKKHRLAISKGVADAWKNMSDDDRAAISQTSKEKWDNMSDAEQQHLRDLAMAAYRETSKKGSRAERHIMNGLREMGYSVVFHKRDLVYGSKLEVDLYIPELKTAVEIDGPAHFIPIWGEEKLAKQQAADVVKQGILLSQECAIVRVRQIDKNMSLSKMQTTLSAIVGVLEEINKKFPSRGQRLIEIEVKDGEVKRLSGSSR